MAHADFGFAVLINHLSLRARARCAGVVQVIAAGRLCREWHHGQGRLRHGASGAGRSTFVFDKTGTLTSLGASRG